MSEQTTTPMFAREDAEDIAVLRMAHGKVNALDVSFCTALTGELDRIRSSRRRALVITGTGSAFSAGVDLFRLLESGAEYVATFLPSMNAFFRVLLEFPKPVVAAVNGHAIAGGCIITAAADYRLMSRGVGRIGVPELVVGVPFPALPFEIIAARLSPAMCRSVIYMGRTVAADEAVTIGLVDEALEQDHLMERALAVAQQLSAIPAATFAHTKRQLIAPILERVARADDSDVIHAWSSDEVHAAVSAYLERTIRKN